MRCADFFLAIAPHISWGQANALASAPLPPAAQEAVNKGVIAAKVPDYLLAIRFFEDARKLAPQAPVIFLNLGLAESRIPGRELRAIAWFGAYLAAYPDAPNAAAVKEQIAVLDVRNQSNLSRFLKTVEYAAMQLPTAYKLIWKDGRTTLEEATLAHMVRDKGLAEVSKLWAAAGDIPTALKTVDSIKVVDEKGDAQRYIAWVQAEAGDIAGAQKTVDSIQDANEKSKAQAALSKAQADHKNRALVAIAKAQAKAGNIADAQMTADSVQDAFWKRMAQSGIAEAQEKISPGGSEAKAARIRMIVVNGWIMINDNLLNAPIFLNPGDYLKTLHSGDSRKTFVALRDAAEKTAHPRQQVTNMLKWHVQPPAKP